MFSILLIVGFYGGTIWIFASKCISYEWYTIKDARRIYYSRLTREKKSCCAYILYVSISHELLCVDNNKKQFALFNIEHTVCEHISDGYITKEFNFIIIIRFGVHHPHHRVFISEQKQTNIQNHTIFIFFVSVTEPDRVLVFVQIHTVIFG